MGFGITHKLFGFVWKGQMRLLYPSAAEYAVVMADVASYTGAATIAFMLASKPVFQVRRRTRLGGEGVCAIAQCNSQETCIRPLNGRRPGAHVLCSEIGMYAAEAAAGCW